MAKYTFEVYGKITTGITQRVPDVVNNSFESFARCPVCNNKFTAKKMAKQNRTVSELEASVKFLVRKHYKNVHKKE